MFCLPYAGGSSLAFQRWVSPVDGLDLVRIDYPGHLLRPDEALEFSMDGLVDRVIPEVIARLDVAPILFGASLGALVALELAHRAVASGCPPRGLIVAACAAPQCLNAYPRIGHLPDLEFLQALAARYGGLPLEILSDHEVRAMLLPQLRADMTVFETYLPPERPPLACDVVVVAGDADLAVTSAHMAGWSAVTHGKLIFIATPGGHFFPETNHAELLARLATPLHHWCSTAPSD